MASTAAMLSEAMKHAFAGIEEQWGGKQFIIPILSSEDRAWRDAVRWLEAREAARDEWTFPW